MQISLLWLPEPDDWSISCVYWICLTVLAKQQENIGPGYTCWSYQGREGESEKVAPVSASVPGESPSAPLAYALRSANFTYRLYTFKTATFVMVPEVSRSAFKLFKRSTLVPYSTLGFLDVSLIGFKSQTFLGFVSSLQVSGIRVSNVGHEPLILQGEVTDLWDYSWLWVTMLQWGFGVNASQPLPPI